VFEAALGPTPVLGALSGALTFPHPVGRTAVTAVGVVLLGIAAVPAALAAAELALRLGQRATVQPYRSR